MTEIVEFAGRKYRITADPRQAILEHSSVGKRLCSGQIEIQCLGCETFIPITAQFRYTPPLAGSPAAVSVRPGSDCPATCSRDCRREITAAPKTKVTDAESRQWDTDTSLLNDEVLAPEHQPILRLPADVIARLNRRMADLGRA
ncbi:hypothetical protein [Novipirellula artificiosorum]|uniref:Uncharacterized protein n=1 Tax=Novipirellula artificiosorum TaxID=2528016 RepID=A0A5C6DM73_9BACT|nr:hypothetical protein [Novipirellula artificiosorum]TWU37275.1 hypothetical protein Poly41_34040 [Novipirellula artificiosorum]